MVYAPEKSGYVQPDEDKTLNRFNPWPETYRPNPDYPGSCVPGLGDENQPLSQLDLEVKHEETAFFEVPFHLRWPTNHPYLRGPYDRLEIAGRFVEGDEADASNFKKAHELRAPKLEKVEKLDVHTAGVEETRSDSSSDVRDPLFDDTSSSLLDAALGLDDAPPSTSSAAKASTKSPNPAFRSSSSSKLPVSNDEDDTFDRQNDVDDNGDSDFLFD